MKFAERWIFYVAKRFSIVDKKGASYITSRLAVMGICFGVMTLILVMSVMNGFQREFIDSIMEISSYHARIESAPDLFDSHNFIEGLEEIKKHPGVKTAVPFMESDGLMASKAYDDDGKQISVSKQAPALIRAVPYNVCELDSGFEKEVKMIRGDFDIQEAQTIVLGSTLARSLGVTVGQTINIFALGSSSDVPLLSSKAFCVTGIFHSGYGDINSSYAFINLEEGKRCFGKSSPLVLGIKLFDPENERHFIKQIKNRFPELSVKSWREYNRSFFGALKIEKNTLLLLVFLIFVVVAINIYNSLRRLVYERRLEISTLSALGGKTSSIKNIFLLRGFIMGLSGSIPGLVLGLFLCVNIKTVFLVLSKLLFLAQSFFVYLFSPQNAIYLDENPMFQVYSEIPARMFPAEIILITLFGIFSAVISSVLASKQVLKINIGDVLHEE